MPLYEYQCPDCGRFELLQKYSDAPLTVCPRCGKGVEKLLSAPAIQFKGTGWYVTDYARKKGPGADTSSNGNNGNDSSATTKSSSKDGPASTPRTTTSKDSAATGSSSTK